MADIKSSEERSKNMGRIRSRDTKPEEYLRKELYHYGYRYRKNVKTITGQPDIWLGKFNTAIFVNGCFWHRHRNCKFAYTPKSHVEFWESKFQRNTERDRYVISKLTREGIRVLIVWECTINSMKKKAHDRLKVVSLINEFLQSEQVFLEI